MNNLLTTPNLTITQAAQDHFVHLLEKEAVPGIALRIFVDAPGSARADVNISFCLPGEHRAGDVEVSFEQFTLYIERQSVPFLEGAHIDYKAEGDFASELSISAPNLRPVKPSETASLEERVHYILEMEVNPGLASHGGRVALVEITPEKQAVLRFGGGCHGCGMVDVTLKQGIEKTLLNQIPELVGVVDATDHSLGENPYYVE